MTTTSVIPHDRLHVIREVEHELSRKFTDPKAMPVQHNLSDLGRMSAEAVMTQYEATAQCVEDMGKTVKGMAEQIAAKLVEYDTDMKRMVAETSTMVRDTANKLAEVLVECDADMKIIKETSEAIREKGKHSQALIEQVSALSGAIRETCADFRQKMGT
jgi:hypothetical protein